MPVLTPAEARRPRVPRPAARPRRRLLPGRRLRRAAAAARARRPAARLGQPALLAAAAWRGAAPVQHAILHGDDVTGASTFLIEAGLDTGPVFGVVTEAIRPDRHQRRPARPAGRVAAPGCCVATMDGIADGSLVPRPAAGRRRVGRRQDHRRRRRGVAGTRRRATSTGWCGPARPAPGAWTTFRGERLKLGPVRLRGANDLRPGELRVERGRRRGRHRDRRGRARHRAAAGQAARCRRPTGRAVRGIAAGETLG